MKKPIPYVNQQKFTQSHWSEHHHLDELEQVAEGACGKDEWLYLSSGWGKNTSMTGNRQALDKIKLIPRYLKNVSQLELVATWHQQSYQSPIFLCPTARQDWYHPKGELATVSAAVKHGIPMCASMVSGHAFDTLARASNNSGLWMQIYPAHRSLVKAFIKKAVKSNCSGLVVTVDIKGSSDNLQRTGDFKRVSSKIFDEAGNFKDHTHLENLWKSGQDMMALDQDYCRWIKQQTHLPVILKGVLHPDDVSMALEAGIDGIILSNHGGRQLDDTVSAIEMLPSIRAMVGADYFLAVDGGVRSGLDVFKCLALGADFVGIGRPISWALSVDGESGVDQMLQVLIKGLRCVMQQMGFASIDEIKSDGHRFIQS